LTCYAGDGERKGKKMTVIYQTPGTPTDAELLVKARAVVCEHRRGSISLVQRHLRIGYNHAARLLEQLERDGVIEPCGNNGARKVLVKA
jgi:S-DNA-T family DNA segregation ATPase FtsK/SpoIIIE